MSVLVTGAGGFIGARLVKALLARGTLAGADGGQQKIERMVLVDTAFPGGEPTDPRVTVISGSIADPEILRAAVAPGTRSVFHLAAVVSSGAEADFDLGMRINLDGTRALLEACRALGTCPRLVFASSVAVFGGKLPEVVEDDTPARPDFSYGLQKLMGEQLIDEYTRRGFIDGRAPRLPTIVVRPGRPNLAASSFASSIVREPLEGRDYDCPVAPEQEVCVLSPKRVVEAFIALHEIDGARLGRYRQLTLPGLVTSVAEMVEEVRRVGGEAAAKRIHFRPDPDIRRIVDSWPTRFRTERALALGLKGDQSIAEIVDDFAANDMRRSN